MINGEILMARMYTLFCYGGSTICCHFSVLLSMKYVVSLKFMTYPNSLEIKVAKLIKSAEKVATISLKSTLISSMKVFLVNYLLKVMVKLNTDLGSFSLVNY